MAEEKPEGRQEAAETDGTERGPFAGMQWASDPSITLPPEEESVRSAGLYADTLRREAGIEPPSPPEREPIIVPPARWMYQSGQESRMTPEQAQAHRRTKTDQLLEDIRKLDDEALGFRDPSRPTGYRENTLSHQAALRERVYPQELREAMEERIQEIAQTPRAELARIPTMEEIREEAHRALREKKRLSPQEKLMGGFSDEVMTLPSDPFAPMVPKRGRRIPATQVPIVNKLAEIYMNTMGDEPVLLYDPERADRRKRRHERSHEILERARETPGFETSRPIHLASLQERLRQGEFPNISASELQDAVETTLKKFTAEFKLFRRTPRAPIEEPQDEMISETDPHAAHGQMLRGNLENQEPTSENWPESIQSLYSSIRGEGREEGVTRAEQLGFTWTEELAFLDALAQIIDQKRRIEGSPTSEGQAEALLRSLERVMSQQQAQESRREFGGQ